MRQLEEKLDELLVKKAPFQIPKEGREGIAKAMPWVALVGGIILLLLAWTLYNTLNYANRVIDVANSYLGGLYDVGYVAPVAWGPLVWLSLALLVAVAVMFFMAYPGLTKMKKSAWDLLFWAALLNIAEAVLQAIGYTNIGSLIASLLGSVVGLYVLFQIRPLYNGAHVTVTPPPAAPTPTSTPPADAPKDDKTE